MNLFFFLKGKEKLCGCGEEGGTCVLGFPNYTAVLSLSTPEIHTPGNHRSTTDKQGKGSDGSQLLSLLSGQLSSGQGGVGDTQEDTTLPSSHGGDVPSRNSLLCTRARGGRQAPIPSFRLHFSGSSKKYPSVLNLFSFENGLVTMN